MYSPLVGVCCASRACRAAAPHRRHAAPGAPGPSSRAFWCLPSACRPRRTIPVEQRYARQTAFPLPLPPFPLAEGAALGRFEQ
ncbi:MAG: hypothetical protein BJ554DRAFT_5354 [Olpidium bornovanus]|uniref:Uncharacterized protein n=1 Tax=Olpidium bornovanus TaxID=278681 RepID=A0A8H8A0D6_9FUNG|nr:MAG: hypothetical protein BJ554DRAFT_5354 [Olpidium bornovanus]